MFIAYLAILTRLLTVCVSALLYLLQEEGATGRVGSCVSLGATIES